MLQVAPIFLLHLLACRLTNLALFLILYNPACTAGVWMVISLLFFLFADLRSLLPFCITDISLPGLWIYRRKRTHMDNLTRTIFARNVFQIHSFFFKATSRKIPLDYPWTKPYSLGRNLSSLTTLRTLSRTILPLDILKDFLSRITLDS